MAKTKILLSYHSDDEEAKNTFVEKYQDQFEFIFSETMEEINDRLFSDQDLIKKTEKEIIKDAEAMIILIGSQTWKRKAIDWEIAGIINQQKGLIGILLSTNNNFGFTKKLTDHNTIPTRLVENAKTDYAQIYNWNIISMKPNQWVETAISNAKTHKNHNSGALLRRNL